MAERTNRKPQYRGSWLGYALPGFIIASLLAAALMVFAAIDIFIAYPEKSHRKEYKDIPTEKQLQFKVWLTVNKLDELIDIGSTKPDDLKDFISENYSTWVLDQKDREELMTISPGEERFSAPKLKFLKTTFSIFLGILGLGYLFSEYRYTKSYKRRLYKYNVRNTFPNWKGAYKTRKLNPVDIWDF